MTAGVRVVKASAVRAGDLVIFLGTAHRISRIEPYEHPTFRGETWGVAHEDATGWSLVLAPGTWLEVAS